VKYYQDGVWINDEDLANEILEYTEDRHPWETAEQRISDVRYDVHYIAMINVRFYSTSKKFHFVIIPRHFREIMRRVVRKGREQDPLENVDEKLTHLT
jgi:hypothetical protein